MIKALAVFTCLFAVDFVWAKYTYAMARKRAHTAAGYASLIILTNGVAVIFYSSEPLMLLPAALGAYFGTLVAVKMHGSDGF